MLMPWKSLLALGALALGAWMHEAVEALATDTKLVLARALIWGSIAAAFALFLTWKPLLEILSRWATRAEQNRQSSLSRSEQASRLERVLIAIFLFLSLFLSGLAFVASETFLHLFAEDGPFETATALCYAVAAAACLVFAFRAQGHRSLRISLGFLAALFIVVGGEEISWGQRLLDFETPESLAAVNVQSEFTLHNVYSISIFTYPALAMTAMLLFVAPLLQSMNPKARRIFHALELPVAPPLCALLYGVAIGAYLAVGLRLGTPTPLPISYWGYAPHFDDEMLEFLIAALFAIFAVANWRWRLPEEALAMPRATEVRLSQ